MSPNFAKRCNVTAANPVIPDPANKSTTSSPGLVKVSIKGLIPAMGTFVK